MSRGRRFGGYGMRRPNSRGAGGRVSGALLALADGTFSRSSSAWALDSDGLLQEYASNELRTEYRSGAGLYLLEGERTNLVAYYRDPTQWVLSGATLVSSTEDDMLGGSNAGQFSGTTGDTIDATLATSPADSTIVSGAVWVRGTGTVRIRVRAKDGSFHAGSDVTLTSSYQRIDTQGSTLTGATVVRVGVEIRASGTTVDVFGFQLEDVSGSPMPSSDIVTDGAAATRAADDLTFTSSEVPDEMVQGVFAFDARPLFSGAELSSINWLLSWQSGTSSTQYGIKLQDVSGAKRVYLMENNSVLRLVNVAFERFDTLTFTMDMVSDELTLSGFTTGDGTYGAAFTTPWPRDTLYVGAFRASSNYAFAALSDVRRA